MRINRGGPALSLKSIVLFRFDDYSIPFQHGAKLSLIGKQTGHGNKPVVPLGEEGAHDSLWIAYYGTVLEIDGELWMWYLGQGPDEHWHQRVCLAKSKDGRTWDKPDLGLVGWHGSKHNNLVDMGEDTHVQACVIFREPDDQDQKSVSRWHLNRVSIQDASVSPKARTVLVGASLLTTQWRETWKWLEVPRWMVATTWLDREGNTRSGFVSWSLVPPTTLSTGRMRLAPG